MRLLHEIAIFQTVKSKVIISLFETVRLSVSISLRNLYNSLNSIKEWWIRDEATTKQRLLKHVDIWEVNQLHWNSGSSKNHQLSSEWPATDKTRYSSALTPKITGKKSRRPSLQLKYSLCRPNSTRKPISK